jgi:hypothetical protein
VLDVVAYRIPEGVKDHLPGDKDKKAKGDMAERPSVLEGVHDQEKLHD